MARRRKSPRRGGRRLRSFAGFIAGKNQTAKLYEVLQRLHESSPNEAPITADLARLGLNTGQNTEQSHQLAKEAYDRAPNEVNCALTYAFSLSRLGRNAEAVTIVESLSPEQLHDPHAAVYVALLLAQAGQIEAANNYIAIADDEKIYSKKKSSSMKQKPTSRLQLQLRHQ